MTAAAADTRSENPDETPADTPADGRTDGRTEGRTRRGGRWIEQWDPEDETFWRETGERIARRNLVFSVLSEHIGFSIWTLWSVMVLFMGPGVRDRPGREVLPDGDGRRWSAPCSGCRTPSPWRGFGGRNWTIISAGDAAGADAVAAFAVMEPGTSYTTFLLVAALAGVGGGNFASSMTNINSFFPLRKKGWALGLNAGGGNIGVPVIQLLGLLVIGTAGAAHPRIAAGRLHPADRRRRGARGAVHGQPGAGEERHRRGQGRRAGRRTPGSCRSSTSARSGRSSATASPSGWSCQNQFGAHARCRPRRSPSSARCSAR